MKLPVYVITTDNLMIEGWIHQRKMKEPFLYLNTTRVKKDDIVYIRDILAEYQPQCLEFYCPQ